MFSIKPFKKKKSKKKFFSFPGILAYSFAAIAIIQTLSLSLAFQSPEMAQAAEKKQTTYEMQVSIPGLGDTIEFGDTTEPIVRYIEAIYNYAIGIVGILAAIMLMVGGFRWILAGGNASSISEAKEMIFAALSGLVLLMTSYLILNAINPDLVNLKITDIKDPLGQNFTEDESVSNLCKWVTLTDKDYISKTAGKSSDFKETCATAGETWTYINGACSKNGEKDDNICCCEPLPEGCTSYKISCKACSNPVIITSFPSHLTCKYTNSCKVSNDFFQKLITFNNKYSESGLPADLMLVVTEAWPPTINHVSIGHQDGTCIDLVTENRNIMSSNSVENTKIIENLYSSFKNSGFSKVLYECYSKDSCNCDNYNISSCGDTESGEKAGGKNHFHICL